MCLSIFALSSAARLSFRSPHGPPSIATRNVVSCPKSFVHSIASRFIFVLRFFSSSSNHTHSQHRNIYLFFCFVFFCSRLSHSALVFFCPAISHWALFFIAGTVCAVLCMYDSFHSFAVTMRHLRLSFHRSVPINKIFDGIRHTTHARTLALTRTHRPTIKWTSTTKGKRKKNKNTIWTYAAASYTFLHHFTHLARTENERRKLFLCKFIGYSPKTGRGVRMHGVESRVKKGRKKTDLECQCLARRQWELNVSAKCEYFTMRVRRK